MGYNRRALRAILDPGRLPTPLRRAPVLAWAYALSFLWLLVAALASLAPALSKGSQLGDFELLSVFGWGGRTGVPLHNVVSSDQIQEMVPWTDLNWLQVHAGHLPLWNPFAGLGLPLAFNFQSASFSLPMAVGYLFPLHLAYTATVVTKLVIAGTGATFLGRVLGLRLFSATFGGTVFELSGALTAWSGWPQAGVFCWMGWILGAVVYLIRGSTPWRAVPLLALFVGLSVLGGHPESMAIELAGAAIFAGTLLIADVLGGAEVRRRAWRSAVALSAGIGGGLLLAAPLLLPGLQVIGRSSHTTSTGYSALPLSDVANLALATFDGLPVLHQDYVGTRNYYVGASYVGLGVLVLAALAIVLMWRRAEIIALTVLGTMASLVLFSAPVASVLSHLPLTRLVLWDRAVLPLELCLSILGACGLQFLASAWDEDAQWSLRGFTAFAVLSALAFVAVAALWLYSVFSPLAVGVQANRERLQSLIVPSVQAAVGLLVAVALLAARRSHARRGTSAWFRWAPLPVAAAEVLFLLTATPSLWSSSSRGFAPTAAEVRAKQLIGSARIGFDNCPSLVRQPSLGVLAEANSAYGLRELAAYDPVVPTSWYRAWAAATHTPPEIGINNFCPSVSSAALARRFGVSYIVGPPGAAAPPGTRGLPPIGGESIFAVPGSGIVTVAVPGSAPGAPEQTVRYSSPDDAEMDMTVDVRVPSTLRIHITDLPGWSARIDQHTAALTPWDGTMLSLRVPAGWHRVILRYRPAAFSIGIDISAATALTLLAALGLGRYRRLAGGGVGPGGVPDDRPGSRSATPTSSTRKPCA